MEKMKYSIIIPVFKNEASIPRLLQALATIQSKMSEELEVVFVVDGSPDQSFKLLRDSLERLDFQAQLLAHSRNFGSFPAIRTGLAAARGEYFAVMGADLQEPPELISKFLTSLGIGECDVIVGTRNSRRDPLISRLSSNLFWKLYRTLVVKDMPEGGVDVFGCNLIFRDHLLKLEESRSSLIALIFWLGFRRKTVSYDRQLRQEGKSAWTLNKKIEYMLDSVFAFTDYPIRLLMRIGTLGLLFGLALGAVVLMTRLTGISAVPGYAATMITVIILGTLNLLGIGLVGTYAWRGYENSKQRPLAIVSIRHDNRKSRNELSK